MSFTYGFYNSINHDRKYDSVQISYMFDGLITDGVYRTIGSCFALTVNSGLKVNVGAGRAWFNHTWSFNDTTYILQLPEAHAVFPRIDAIVIRVDRSSRTNALAVVSGNPASNPQRPTLRKSDDIFEHALGYVTVANGQTELKPTDITQVIGSSECPFVTSLMQGVAIDDLLRNWMNEFDALFALLKKQTSQAAAGTLIDKSVTTEKLADGAVTYEIIADGAVRLRFTNVRVAKSLFVSDTQYSECGYEYKATIPLNGATENMRPVVVFSPESMNENDLSGPVFSYNGGIYLYLSSPPISDFVIPVIDLVR